MAIDLLQSRLQTRRAGQGRLSCSYQFSESLAAAVAVQPSENRGPDQQTPEDVKTNWSTVPFVTFSAAFATLFFKILSRGPVF